MAISQVTFAVTANVSLQEIKLFVWFFPLVMKENVFYVKVCSIEVFKIAGHAINGLISNHSVQSSFSLIIRFGLVSTNLFLTTASKLVVSHLWVTFR